MKWYFNGEQPQLQALLEGEKWREQAETVKHNRLRTVSRFSLDTGDCIYIKEERPRTLFSRLKTHWRCKAQKEYTACLNLAEFGVATVQALAWGAARDGRSVLVTAALPNGGDFLLAWHQGKHKPEIRHGILAGLTAFIRDLRQARVHHPDLHTGNILLQPSTAGGTWRCCLVDVYGVALGGTLSASDRINLIRWLIGIWPELSETEQDALLQAAGFGTDLFPFDQARAALYESLRRWNHRKWPGRRQRYSRESSLCARITDETGTWLLRKDWPAPLALEEARDAIARHRDNLKQNRDVLKRDQKRSLTRVQYNDRTLVIKEFSHAGGLFPWAPDRISWLNTLHVERFGAPGVRVLGWHHDHANCGFLLLQDLGNRLLHSEILQAETVAARRKCLQVAVAVLVRLHNAGIAHRDFKLSNLMLPEKSPDEAVAIDLDSTRFHLKLSAKARVRDLAALFESMPQTVPRADYWRVLADYRRGCGLSKDQTHRLARKLHDFLPETQ